MRNARGWMTQRIEASEDLVLLSIWASRQEAASRGMASSGQASLNQVNAGLEALERELNAILRDLTTLPRFGRREQRVLQMSLLVFVDQTTSNILRESNKNMTEFAAGTQPICSSSLQKLKAAVSLWDDLITQRRADQLINVAWEVVRMMGSAALGVLAARLLL